MKITEKTRERLNKIIKLIDIEAKKGQDLKQIIIKLEMEVEGFQYTRRVFNLMLPWKLNQYIRRRVLTLNYLKWRENPKKLADYNQYNNINEFGGRFKTCFGISLQEAYENDISEEDLEVAIDINNYISIIKNIEENKYANLVGIGNGMLNFRLNTRHTLEIYLKTPVYYWPIKAVKELQDLDRIMKALYIYAYSCCTNEGDVILKEEDIMYVCTVAEKYNLENPTICNNICLYFVEIPDLYETFVDEADRYIRHLYSVVPNSELNEEIRNDVICISNASDINIITDYLKIDEQTAIKKLWHYCQLGILRLRK